MHQIGRIDGQIGQIDGQIGRIDGGSKVWPETRVTIRRTQIVQVVSRTRISYETKYQ